MAIHLDAWITVILLITVDNVLPPLVTSTTSWMLLAVGVFLNFATSADMGYFGKFIVAYNNDRWFKSINPAAVLG